MRPPRNSTPEEASLLRSSLASSIATVLAVAVGVVLAVGGILWWGLGSPSFQTPGPWKPADTFSFVKIVLAVTGGTGGVVALVISYRKQRLGEAAEQREDARLYIEGFASATEQMGSQSAAIQLAGAYALEQLAQDAPDKRQTIVNVLCGYLRMPPGSDNSSDSPVPDPREAQVRRTVQRILTLHLQPGSNPARPLGRYWPDIDLDLSGAALEDFTLDDCSLRTVRFDGTAFQGSATFRRLQVTGNAWFRGAQFNGFTTFAAARFHRHASFLDACWEAEPVCESMQFMGTVEPDDPITGHRFPPENAAT